MSGVIEQTLIDPVERGGGGGPVAFAGERQTSTAIARATAMIRAAYDVAYQRPRDIMAVRKNLLDACQRSKFAESAQYAKPVGGKKIVGLSIRFAEEALRAFGNLTVYQSLVHDTPDDETWLVTITDYEANTSSSKEFRIGKTVERSSTREGQVVRGERKNSLGKTTYIVDATEDELAVKREAAASKVRRGLILSMIPSDLREEAEDAIRETIEKGDTDPKAAAKKLVDSFGTLGITPKQLADYLKHPVAEGLTKAELQELRLMYVAIKEGSATWSEYLGEDGEARPKVPTGTKKEAAKEGEQ